MGIGKMIQLFLILLPGAAGYNYRGCRLINVSITGIPFRLQAAISITRSNRVSPLTSTLSEKANAAQ